MSFFGGPPFDFNGNGKLDFHEFMIVTEGLRRQQEENERQNSFNYGRSSDNNDDEDNNNNW